MLTEQLGVRITEAFVRLRAYAYANDLQLADVARDIVARRLRLLPDPVLARAARPETLADVCGTTVRVRAAILQISWGE